jgi:hypothetical protein
MQFDKLTEDMALSQSQKVEQGDNSRRQSRNRVVLDIFRITETLDDPADAYEIVIKIRKYLCGP